MGRVTPAADHSSIRVPAVELPRRLARRGEVDMSRSRLFGRVLGSATGLVALVAVVGAGWKW